MNAAGGIWAPAAMRAVRIAASRAAKVVRTRLARPVQTALEPVLARASPPRQPIHPVAFLRQQKSRSIHSRASSAAARQFSTAPRPHNTKFLKTKVGRAVSQFAGRAPFASTLRPNLTGGALPRSAGGYGLGSGRIGGARFFSHGPASHAQVIQNVSQAVRAFWISGQKAQFDGLNARGEARFRAVSAVQDQTMRKLSSSSSADRTPGSNLDFRLNPTVTALGPLAAAFPFPSAATATANVEPSINTEGFLDVLSGDFARALKDLTATLTDLQKLAALGDLPIQLVESKGGHILRVRFPGVDADTVEALCLDLGLTRGIVTEDPEFGRDAPVALKFPFASTVLSQDIHSGLPWQSSYKRAAAGAASAYFGTDETESDTDEDEITAMFFDQNHINSNHDNELDDDGFSEIVQRNPWLASPSDSSSLPSLNALDTDLLDGHYDNMSSPFRARWSATLQNSSNSFRGQESSNSFEGVEGVYRFLEECDRARDRF
ncbi:uncharacterized protein B0I36DRAFT_317121 [Microdochium trichocladiopsis]|uniref:Casein kinase II beta 2 subunit n=1 Tax=Microdochium trichocladiopsis TaxID=1682393 RepID=A0A9P8YAK9_9PEZI|nr:uncharacterized protein B0I36DRAFT_317121 [Microdochium trichocladiopsis]KAH7034866.1 hypothetical protein B0I36DRAFT_317121 [Microdochium trichocladiopsis]